MTPRALLGLAADALFPPRCLLCDEVLGFLPECPACRGELARLSRGHAPGIACAPPALDGAFAAFWYEDGVREAVHRMKYQDRPDLARLFAAHMAAALPEGLGADGVIPESALRSAATMCPCFWRGTWRARRACRCVRAFCKRCAKRRRRRSFPAKSGAGI